MIQERSIDLPAVQLNYASSSDEGPALVLFHGVTRRWQSFLPIWSGLQPNMRLIAWDARGHGKSNRASGNATLAQASRPLNQMNQAPADDSSSSGHAGQFNGASGYQVVDYVQDAIEFVQHVFNRPCVLYGHSLGAMVALATAAAIPHAVRAVVLEDPPFNTMGERIETTPLLSFFRGLLPFAGHQRDIAAVARELAEIRLSTAGLDRTVRLGDTRDVTSLRFTARSLTDLDPRVLQDIVSGQWLTGYDFQSLLPKVRCPVLLLQADSACGAMLTDPDVELLTGALADCTLVKFPNAPHLIHAAQPELLLRHVIGFLESLP